MTEGSEGLADTGKVQGPQVAIVGAGPGRPDLITIRGKALIETADLVLFDALIDPEVLGWMKPGATAVPVGKRFGRVSERQEAIHQQMLAAAQEGKSVVRLKGGDPMIFGRVLEELHFLAQCGIAFEVVPGVSAASGAAAYAGIPLTHRFGASSVTFVTGVEAGGSLANPLSWAPLAQVGGTLVIFMGVHRAHSLCEALMDGGLPPSTPAAMVESATLPSQKVIEATVATLAERLTSHDANGARALFIIGPRAVDRQPLAWFEHLPLAGKKVWVARPEAQSGELALRIRNLGGEPISAPLIKVEPLPEAASHLQLLFEKRFDWVVLTSANGAAALGTFLRANKKDARALGGAKIAAIGPATSRVLEGFGILADLVPDEFVAEALAAAILRHGSPGRVALVRAEEARPALITILSDAGASVDVIPVYRTIATTPNMPECDVVLMTSPSMVRSFVERLKAEHGHDHRPAIGAIGPITATAVRELGLECAFMAEQYNEEGLLKALVSWAKKAIPSEFKKEP